MKSIPTLLYLKDLYREVLISVFHCFLRGDQLQCRLILQIKLGISSMGKGDPDSRKEQLGTTRPCESC